MKLLKLVQLLVVAALLLSASLSYSEPLPVSAADPEPQPVQLPKNANPKLDSRLNRVLKEQNDKTTSRPAQQNPDEVGTETVRVIIETSANQMGQVRQAASGLGTVEASDGNLLQVNVLAGQLAALADLPGVRFVRTPYSFVEDVVSEGVAVIGADVWQNASYNGSGVKVGIVDGGFAGYTTRQAEGELPASITTWWAPSIGNEGTEKHGTGVAEIVYDVAPGAQFYLANVDTEVDLGNAVDWMIAQGVNVISMSLGWYPGGPGDGTGPIAVIVNRARAAGILWVNSAGNSAREHWQGNFVDTDGDTWHEFSQPSPFDENQSIFVQTGASIIVFLKWDDPWGSSSNNYDLYLTDNQSIIRAASEDVQNGNDDPVEALQFTGAYTGFYRIWIKKVGSPAVRNFHLYSLVQTLEYQVASGSLTVPADSPNVMTAGAVYWNNAGTIESFSSQGPTTDGRTKPDIVAPDGVSTRAYSPGTFSGTSASAPHVAGAAALVKQAYPSYDVVQIQAFLEGRAVDLGDAGKDNVFGSGRLSLGYMTPLVTTDDATTVSHNSASLSGNLTSLGTASSANVTFQWGGESENYTASTIIQTMNTTGSFSSDLTSLSANTTYYFRAKASGQGDAYGVEKSFTTLAIPVPTGLVKISLDNNPFTAFKWNAVDNATAYQVMVDSGNWTDIGNRLTYVQPTILGKGSHTFQVRTKDLWGSASSAASLSFNVTVTADLANTKIAFVSNRDGNMEIYVMNTNVTGVNRLTTDTSHDSYPSWSPDVSKILFTPSRDGQQEIYMMNKDGSNQVRLTNSLGSDFESRWFPDGQKIVFTSSRDNSYEIYVMNADGSGQTNLTNYPNPNLAYNQGIDWQPAVSPDGTRIAFVSTRGSVPGTSQNLDIYLMNADGSDVERLTSHESSDENPSFSPDGKTVAFNSHRNTYSEIYLMDVDGTNQRRLTYSASSQTGHNLRPIWSPDGSKILFERATNGVPRIYSINLDGTGETNLTDSMPGDNFFPSWSPFLTPPTVTTNNAANITYSSAVLSGNLTSLGTASSANVTFQWGGESENYTASTIIQTMNTAGSFSSDLTSLSANTTYFFRAKAAGDGAAYGIEKSFTTLPTTPVVSTDNATEVTFSFAILNGTLTSFGTASSANVSFQWGLNSENYTGEISSNYTSMNSTGVFSGNLTGLSPATTYYFRARAVGDGAGYGEERSFTTAVIPSPSVITDEATNITFTSAQLNGNLTSLGTASSVNVSFELGVTSGNFTGYTVPQTVNATGSYSFALGSLSPNQTVYFRAKAVGNGTSYGEEKSFTTPAGTAPSVTTDNATNITHDSAWLNGSLASLGTADSVNVSFQWGTSPLTYTAETTAESMNVTGDFYFILDSLSANTTYYFRARALGHGTFSGSEKSFTTLPTTPPSVTTENASDIRFYDARLNGNLSSLGTDASANVSFQWGISSDNYTVETPVQTTNITGPFSANLTGSLSANTTYYFRAKAAGQGTGYGEELSFTTLPTTPPDVITGNATNVSYFSATLSGTLTELGTAASVNVTFRWGTSSGNLTSNTSVQTMNATGLFSLDLGGLSANTTYYYRARAEGHDSDSGSERSFTTLATTLPTVTTLGVASVTSSGARLSGNLTSLGTADSVNVSFQWGTSPESYTAETAIQPINAIGTFQADVALLASTTYYFRAKVAGHGVAFGDEMTFTTSEPPPPSSGGGGGGGGGAPSGIIALGVNGFLGVGPLINAITGVTLNAVNLISTDGKASVAIIANTTMLMPTGLAVTGLSAIVAEPPAEPSPGGAIILNYEFGPDGARFDPALTIVMSYADDQLPSGFSEANLYLAFWDGSEWVQLASIVNPEDNTVTGKVEHFTSIALIAGKPAQPVSVVQPPPFTPDPTPDPAPAFLSPQPLTPEPQQPSAVEPAPAPAPEVPPVPDREATSEPIVGEPSPSEAAPIPTGVFSWWWIIGAVIGVAIIGGVVYRVLRSKVRLTPEK